MVNNTDKYIIKTPNFSFNRKCGGIGHVLFKTMKTHSEKIFQTDSKSGKTETFESFLQRCISTALALQEMGIEKGDVVPIICYLDMDCRLPFFASLFIGALPCPLSKNLDNLGTLLKDLNPKVAFVSEEAIEKLAVQLDYLEVVIIGESKKHKTLKYVISSIQDQKLHNFEPIFVEDLSERAMVQFSSGTTGKPKGTILSHLSLIANSPYASLTENGKELNLTLLSQLPNKNLLLYSPLYWISCPKCSILSTILGWNIIITNESFDPKEAWEFIEKYKVHSMFNFTAYVVDMYNYGRPENLDASSLSLIITAGMCLPTKYIDGLEKMLPGTLVVNAYGSTEAGDLAYWNVQKDEHIKMKKAKPKSVGVFARGKWYKVVDPDTEEILGPNQTGELRVKGEDMFVDLYNGNYSECFDEDGWFKTGDLVYYDEDNCVFIVDRIKESFKYLGSFVYATDIEEVLVKHPSVRDCLVFGQPHEKDGNHPTALVVLNEDCVSVSEEEIQNFVNEKVKETYKIRGGVKFVKSIPKTETGKKLRRQAKKIFEAQ